MMKRRTIRKSPRRVNQTKGNDGKKKTKDTTLMYM